ncbi:hypothetical protein V6N11_001083 [Hibiscus sabdariffa]|uniref:Uncharacterized protein n=1 Tax=Hibiscus sabdariffa TaxID=183260 RepID=A0ABR2RZE0_9ROSI
MVDSSLKLSDVILEDSSWNVLLFQQILQPQVIPYLLSIAHPHPNLGEDRCYWIEEGKRIFSVGAPYALVSRSQWADPNPH